MVCKNCKRKINDNSLFCPHCGMIPTIDSSSNNNNETVVCEQKKIVSESILKLIQCILPILSVAVICLWFCKTISLNASSTSGLYGLEFSLFYLSKGMALLSVALAVVSLIIRIFILLKKDRRDAILYYVSVLSDVVSLGCLVYKLIDVNAIVLNGTYENLNSAGFSFNTLGWCFVAVITLSIDLHVLLIIKNYKSEMDH